MLPLRNAHDRCADHAAIICWEKIFNIVMHLSVGGGYTILSLEGLDCFCNFIPGSLEKAPRWICSTDATLKIELETTTVCLRKDWVVESLAGKQSFHFCLLLLC